MLVMTAPMMNNCNITSGLTLPLLPFITKTQLLTRAIGCQLYNYCVSNNLA